MSSDSLEKSIEAYKGSIEQFEEDKSLEKAESCELSSRSAFNAIYSNALMYQVDLKQVRRFIQDSERHISRLEDSLGLDDYFMPIYLSHAKERVVFAKSLL